MALGPKLLNNPKELWKTVRKSGKSESVGIPAILNNDELTSDNFLEAVCFNNFFQSVFSTTELVVRESFETTFDTMPEFVVEDYGVLKLLRNLKFHSAMGPDGIPNYVLKVCAAAISPFLVILFNKSLFTSRLPLEWKTANVVPIRKSGQKSLVSNYRPISLTCFCSKLLEHIIYSNMVNHLESNTFFSKSQHGFRAGLSCTTQLTEFLHDLSLSLDKNVRVDCLLLDFQKAFDKVPHSLLMHKLSFLALPDYLFG